MRGSGMETTEEIPFGALYRGLAAWLEVCPP